MGAQASAVLQQHMSQQPLAPLEHPVKGGLFGQEDPPKGGLFGQEDPPKGSVAKGTEIVCEDYARAQKQLEMKYQSCLPDGPDLNECALKFLDACHEKHPTSFAYSECIKNLPYNGFQPLICLFF